MQHTVEIARVVAQILVVCFPTMVGVGHLVIVRVISEWPELQLRPHRHYHVKVRAGIESYALEHRRAVTDKEAQHVRMPAQYRSSVIDDEQIIRAVEVPSQQHLHTSRNGKRFRPCARHAKMKIDIPCVLADELLHQREASWQAHCLVGGEGE